MLIDRIVLFSFWALTIIGLILLIPRNKIRDAQLVFLFKQVITWISGLTTVQFRLLEYPVRMFYYATRASFSFEYFIYPAVCVVFVLRYPESKSRWHKMGWYLFFPTWMTILEVLIERYTDLIKYLHWNWFFTWITLLITFYMSRSYYVWFTKKQIGNSR